MVLPRHIGDKGIGNKNILWDNNSCAIYNKIKHRETCYDNLWSKCLWSYIHHGNKYVGLQSSFKIKINPDISM